MNNSTKAIFPFVYQSQRTIKNNILINHYAIEKKTEKQMMADKQLEVLTAFFGDYVINEPQLDCSKPNYAMEEYELNAKDVEKIQKKFWNTHKFNGLTRNIALIDNENLIITHENIMTASDSISSYEEFRNTVLLKQMVEWLFRIKRFQQAHFLDLQHSYLAEINIKS